MGRPTGTKNKSPFRFVALGELTQRLKDTCSIPVKREFVDAILGDTEEDCEENEAQATSTTTEEEERIQVTRHVFNKPEE